MNNASFLNHLFHGKLVANGWRMLRCQFNHLIIIRERPQ